MNLSLALSFCLGRPHQFPYSQSGSIRTNANTSAWVSRRLCRVRKDAYHSHECFLFLFRSAFGRLTLAVTSLMPVSRGSLYPVSPALPCSRMAIFKSTSLFSKLAHKLQSSAAVALRLIRATKGLPRGTMPVTNHIYFRCFP